MLPLLQACIPAAADAPTCADGSPCPGRTLIRPQLASPSVAPVQAKGGLLSKLLHADPKLQPYLEQAQRYRIQVIYTQIRRDAQHHPILTTYQFRQDADFFYPASLIKLPVVLLTLEKLEELGLDRRDRFDMTPSNSCSQYSSNGCRTFQECIERIFVFSDNDAFNRLYEFFGTDKINQALRNKGYRGNLRQRFKGGCGGSLGQITASIDVYTQAGKLAYHQPAHTSSAAYSPLRSDMRAGNKTVTSVGLVNEPMDFSARSYIPLGDLHQMLIAAIMPEAVPKKQRFAITEQDRAFLKRAMAMRPRDYGSHQQDSFRKFLLIGSDRRMPEQLRIYNKVGLSYGFMTDVSYITDESKGIEFFLSATIYANQNGIMNDGRYEYDTVGYPFMKALGQAIYQYEIDHRAPKL